MAKPLRGPLATLEPSTISRWPCPAKWCKTRVARTALRSADWIENVSCTSRQQPLDVSGDFQGTTPRQGDARAAVAVVMDDARARLEFEADTLLARRPEADAHRLGGVDHGVLEDRQELHAAAVHLLDRRVVVEADVEVPLARLGNAAEDEHVVAARHDEDEPVARAVAGHAVALRDPRHRPAVVAHADDRSAQGIHRRVGQLAGAETSAVDDGIGVIIAGKHIRLLPER